MNNSIDSASIRQRLDLRRYREFVSRYEGWGQVHTSAGKTGRAFFDARQLPDGSIVLGCFLEETPYNDDGVFNARDIIQADFITSEGFNVTTSGAILCTEGGGDEYHFSVESLVVNLVDVPSVTEVQMALLNFSPLAEFDADKGIELIQWPICFSVHELEVTISRGETIDWTAPHRDTLHRTLVTSACSMKRKDGVPVDFQSVTKLANAMLTPLSLAVGTRVGVTTITGVNGHEEDQLISYIGIPPRPFAPIITSATWNADIPAIIRAWFDESIEKPIQITELESAVDMFIDCCSPHITLEARCLLACCLLDALAVRYSKARNKTTILPKKLFKKVLAPRLRDAIAAAAADDKNISDTIKDQLLPKIQGLNRVSFRCHLKAMFNDLDIPTEEGRLGGDMVGQILRVRNRLVHEGEFLSGPLHGAVQFFDAVGPTKAMGFHDYINVLWACFCTLLRLAGYSKSLPDVLAPPFYSGASRQI